MADVFAGAPLQPAGRAVEDWRARAVDAEAAIARVLSLLESRAPAVSVTLAEVTVALLGSGDTQPQPETCEHGFTEPHGIVYVGASGPPHCPGPAAAAVPVAPEQQRCGHGFTTPHRALLTRLGHAYDCPGPVVAAPEDGQRMPLDGAHPEGCDMTPLEGPT